MIRIATIRSMYVTLLLAAMLFAQSALPARSAELTRSNAAVPADFSDTLVTSIASPTALAFTPDGRMLIATQPGQLRVFQNGALRATPALNLAARLCANSERGLLGVAVDPAFASNRFIYLYYTFNKSNSCDVNTASAPVNRVSRFVLPDSSTIDPATEQVLVDNILSPNGNHNAGDLNFGKDGFLYITVGDGGCDYADRTRCAGNNDAARDQHVLIGKILRITRDGAIPATNPYRGSDSARCNVTGRTDPGKKCQETFAWGLRNPFRFAFDPNAADTRFFINDVGQNVWEEIDLGQPGADYGWNVREGRCANGSTSNCGTPPAGMTNPIFDYGHSSGCASITGGAFVPNGVWPASYDGVYLFGDYVCGKIFKLTPASGGGYTASDFVTGLGTNSAVHLRFGPYNATQALYYTSYANGGQIRRIAYTGTANRTPTAAISASPTSGPLPLAVNFDGSGSSDPDTGDTLTYIWNFGDGSAIRETSQPTTSYTYASAGTFTATLRVRDNRGATSAPVTIRIGAGNTPPTPQIIAPTISTRFAVGQTITLQGRATDQQDGTLPDSSLRWRLILHHNEHTHPFLQPTTGNNITFTAPAPEDLAATTSNYLEIELTATDSQGLTTVITQELRPKLVDVTLNTQPSGLRLEVNGTSISGPTTLTSWQGYALNVNAPTQLDSSGQPYAFASWSDGGAAAHTIVTPASASSYTASFSPTSGTGLRGEYFDNLDFSGTRATRVDPAINFNWGQGAPISGIGADTFSVRWTGQVMARYSETYTFYTNSDDGVRLWVNGQKLVDNWSDHGPTENSGSIPLTAGQKYSIVLEYYDQSGGAQIQLSWSSGSQAKQIVPQSWLYPQFLTQINFMPLMSTLPAGYAPDSGALFGLRGNGLRYGWNADNSANARDRNAANSPDQRYDTFNHLQRSPNTNARWEIALPNGSYRVRVVAGDPSYFDSVYKINVEGVLVVNGTPTSAQRWIEGSTTVAVSDGRLTISNAASAANNKICFIDIASA
jgi:glucose/arabinose dehydrogenase